MTNAQKATLEAARNRGLEEAALLIDEWVGAYSLDFFAPVPNEARARDAVAADLLRDMLPRVARAIRELKETQAVVADLTREAEE